MPAQCRSALWRRFTVEIVLTPRRGGIAGLRQVTSGNAHTCGGPAGSEAERMCGPSPLHTDGELGIRKAAWMRLHPVEKWTILVDLGRRAPYLLEKAVLSTASQCNSTPNGGQPNCAETDIKVLGEADAQVRFTEASTLSHTQLWRSLPYAMRLHLAVSLLMWIRALRDVQDTLARTRLPFAHSSRIGKSILTHVFPTRLQEHWVDWLTQVTCKMDDKLNNTAEQIPAPHTWDPETSETVEDPGTESTHVIGGHRPMHGQRQLRRSATHSHTGIGLVRKIQGISARPSEDDERAAKFTAGRHRRLQGRGPGKRLTSSHSTDEGYSNVEAARDPEARWGCLAGTPREREGWTMPDASRMPPPVSLVPAAVHSEDAKYHGNEGRGEGCPFTDDGRTSATPIHITVAKSGSSTLPVVRFLSGSRSERTLLACVELHAAVFTSLFIEGRTVQLTVDDATVYAYGQWLLEELLAEKYVTLELVPLSVDPAAFDANTEARAARLLPYFPSYTFPTVLVLMPPRRPKAVSADDISFLASSILQASPCDVLIPHIADEEWEHAAFLTQLKDEVAKQKKQLMLVATSAAKKSRQSSGTTLHEQQLRVSWVTLGRPRTAAEEETISDNVVAKAAFRPAVASAPNAQLSLTTKLLRSLETRSLPAGDASKTTTPQGSGAFLERVSAALENNFYSAQLLYLPHNSSVTYRQLQFWLWQCLPANVRIVGINTAPLSTLFFYPHASFLPQKVGNLFRYRAVTRTVVSRHAKSFSRDPIRYAIARLLTGAHSKARRVRGAGNSPGLGFEIALSPCERLKEQDHDSSSERGTTSTLTELRRRPEDDDPHNALVLERTVDYLANPSKATLLALFVSKIFKF